MVQRITLLALWAALRAGATPIPHPPPPAPRRLPITSPYTVNAFGRTWFVKDSGGASWLPGPCRWSADSSRVFVDDAGQVHLNVAPDAGCHDWMSTEVWDTAARGSGTYAFSVSGPFKSLDPQVTLGVFVFDEDAPAQWHFREIDFEVGKWGQPADPNDIQFVVQPYTTPGNLRRMSLAGAADYGGAWGPAGGGDCVEYGPDGFGGALWQRLTLVLQWYTTPGYPSLLRWLVLDGHHALADVASGAARGSLLGGWDFPFPDRVPPPGDERVRFNLWQANWGGVPERGRRVHVVITNYEFTDAWLDLDAAGMHVPRTLLAHDGGGRGLSAGGTGMRSGAKVGTGTDGPSPVVGQRGLSGAKVGPSPVVGQRGLGVPTTTTTDSNRTTPSPSSPAPAPGGGPLTGDDDIGPSFDPVVVAPGPGAKTTTAPGGASSSTSTPAVNRALVVGATVAGTFLVALAVVGVAVGATRLRKRRWQEEEDEEAERQRQRQIQQQRRGGREEDEEDEDGDGDESEGGKAPYRSTTPAGVEAEGRSHSRRRSTASLEGGGGRG
jgi:hypothetical protein